MIGLTDIHQHLLYGVDDGAPDLETMRRMLTAAAEDGVTELIATPHVTPGLSAVDSERILSRYTEARQWIRSQQLGVTLILGAENLYTPMIVNALQSGQLVTLGLSHYVLIEFVPTIAFQDIETAVSMLKDHGYIPILAHVERYDCLRKNLQRADQLKQRYGALFQMNCQTVIKRSAGLQGLPVRRMLRYGMIDFIASDAHNLDSRRTRLTEAYHALVSTLGQEAAEKICCHHLF